MRFNDSSCWGKRFIVSPIAVVSDFSLLYGEGMAAIHALHTGTSIACGRKARLMVPCSSGWRILFASI